ASVAVLLRALEAHVALAGVVGDDPAGRVLLRLAEEAGIDSLIRSDADRPTTIKDRFVGRAAGRHPHQTLRVDSESREPLGKLLEPELLTVLLAPLRAQAALPLSDYAKRVSRVLPLASAMT